MRWLKTGLMMMILGACSSPQAHASPTEQEQWAKPIKQDANLYHVDNLLYRSEQLVADDVAAVEQLGIKSVVNLRFFDRNDNESILTGRGIDLLNRPLLTWRIKPEDIAEVLYTIKQQQQKGAVLVHCYHGADRTGLIIGMYRIIYQGWSITAAKNEMQQGNFGYHSVWKNLDKLFTAENVDKVKQHLAALEKAAQ